MQTQGTVRRWDAEKGFGFIQSAQTDNVFFHIRDFSGPGTPALGMVVVYEEIHVGGKGPRAMGVRAQASRQEAQAPSHTRHAKSQYPKTRSTPSKRKHEKPLAAPAAGAGVAKGLMAIWLGFLFWGVSRGALPGWWLAAMGGLNALTYLAYLHDKNAAEKGQWRISESKLHLLAVLGGWPAAWWAQQWLRHKSSKQAFREIYWATIALHCLGLAVLVLRPAWALPFLPNF